MKDLRKDLVEVSIAPELLVRGEQQLLSEIKLLEQWLQTLDASPRKDAVSTQSLNTYRDMLRSRQDMLAILRKHYK